MTARIVPGAALAALGLLVLWWLLLGSAPFLSERGPFELWSAWVHLAAVPLAILWRARFFVPVGFWLLSDRETPFDLPILTEQVLEPGFYASAALHEAVIGGAFAILVLASLAGALRVGLPALWRAARSRSPWAMLILVALGCAALAQAIEETELLGAASLFGEEALETLFGLLLITALSLWHLSRREPPV